MAMNGSDENGFQQLADVDRRHRRRRRAIWSTQGIADPERMAIVGWSYGGYAALQSAAIEPTLYKAVGGDRAGDRPWRCSRARRRITPTPNWSSDFVGIGPHVVEGSPLRNAAKIKAPVLLFHGDLDINVGDRAQREDGRGAAAAGGKRSNCSRYKGLDHQLDDSNARAEMLTADRRACSSAAIGH